MVTNILYLIVAVSFSSFLVSMEQLSPEKQKQIQEILKHKVEPEPKQELLQTKYPELFKGIPQGLQKAIYKYIQKMYPKYTDSELEKLYKKGPIDVRAFKWQALGDHFGFKTEYVQTGSVMFSDGPLLQGFQSLMNARDYNAIAMQPTDQAHKKDALNELIGVYKIHLMPKGSLTDIILTLIEGLKNDPELRKLLYKFKVRPNPDLRHEGSMLAAVVIYPAQGKDNAQKALNKIYALFKNVQGTGIAPRYNAKVNDLIWIAQGDGDFKDFLYATFYEKNRIYYRPNITGKVENYHLIHPETKQEIVS